MRLFVPVLLLAGCFGDPEPFFEDTFDPNRIGPGVTPGDDDDGKEPPPPPPAQDCHWPIGSYTLTSAMCGASQHGAWGSTYTTTTMVITHNKVRGCDVVVTFQSDTCKQVAQLWADPEENPKDPTNVVVEFDDYANDTMSYGITSCTPFECKFPGMDTPCTQQGLGEMMTAVDQSDPSKLTFKYFLSWAAPTCNDTLVLSFQKQ